MYSSMIHHGNQQSRPLVIVTGHHRTAPRISPFVAAALAHCTDSYSMGKIILDEQSRFNPSRIPGLTPSSLVYTGLADRHRMISTCRSSLRVDSGPSAVVGRDQLHSPPPLNNSLAGRFVPMVDYNNGSDDHGDHQCRTAVDIVESSRIVPFPLGRRRYHATTIYSSRSLGPSTESSSTRVQSTR